MDTDTFLADVVSYVEEGPWQDFLKYMEDKGYTESEIEEGCRLVQSRAGRG